MSQPLETFLNLDRLCDRFERQWLAGERPDIADYLSQAGASPEAALSELLLVEFDCRCSLGEKVVRAEYLERFAEHREAVQRAFAGWDEREGLTSRTGLESTIFQRQEADGKTTTMNAAGIPTGQGRYDVRRQLGRGGMGVVFLVFDRKLAREVAMKVPHPHLVQDAAAIARFLREAQAAASLHHPGACAVHDLGEENGVPFITMNYIDGRSLAEALKEDGPPGQSRAVEIVLKLAHTLDKAHALGVIHRDLKPANVMIERSGEPVIMDFGLARIREGQDQAALTQDGAMLGSPAYMSPEQIRGEPEEVDARSDIYSLGVSFYELLTGVLPFQGKSRQIIFQATQEDARPAHEVLPTIDRQLSAICARMMARRPADRFASMREVIEALERWQAGSAAVPLSINAHIPSRASIFRRTGAIVATALVALFAVWGVVLVIRTPTATLRVEIDDPAIDVSVDGERLSFHDQRWQGAKSTGEHRLAVAVGGVAIPLGGAMQVEHRGEKHQLVVKLPGGSELASDRFHVLRGKEQAIRITLQKLGMPPEPQSVAVKPVEAGPTSSIESFDPSDPLYYFRARLARLKAANFNDREVSRLRDDLLARQVSVAGTPEALAVARLLAEVPSSSAAWRHKDIPLYERKIIGAGDPERASQRIVRVWGESRMKQWWPLRLAAFSPKEKLLATIDRNCICLWDLVSGELSKQFAQHNSPVNALAFHPSGNSVITGSYEGKVWEWQIASGDMTLLHEGKAMISNFVVTGERQFMLGDNAGNLTAAGDEVRWQVKAADGPIAHVARSPNGALIASVARRNPIRVWRGADGEKSGEFACKLSEPIWAEFLDDDTLLVGDIHAKLHKYRVADGQMLGEISVNTSPDFARGSYQLDRERSRLFARTNRNAVDVFDLTTEKRIHEFPAPLHADYQTSPIFLSPDGQYLACEFIQGGIRVVATEDGRVLHDAAGTPGEHKGAVSSDGRWAAAVSSRHPIDVWNLETGEYRALETMWEAAAAFEPASSSLITGGGNWILRFWNLQTRGLETRTTGFQDWIWSIDIARSGRWVASGNWDGYIEIWDAATRSAVHKWQAHPDRIEDIAISANGQLLVTSGRDDQLVRFWNVSTGQQIREISARAKGTTIDIHPLGSLVAITAGGRLEIYDGQGGLLTRIEKPYADKDFGRGAMRVMGNFLEARFSGDGSRLVASDMSGRLWMFDAKNFEVQETIDLGPGVLRSRIIGFLPDGRHAIVSNPSGTVYAVSLLPP